MPRTRSPDRDRAFELWRDSDGKLQNREIAKQLGIPEKTVSGWKVKDKWSQSLNGVLQNTPKEGTEYSKKKTEQQKRKKRVMRKVVASVEANEELTEKQRLFCMYYIQNFNATQAYLKAYGCSYTTANVEGWACLVKPSIKAEIERLKEIRNANVMVCEEDIVERMMRIAFADITDVAEFDGYDVTVKSSGAVDGAVINSVEATKFGLKVKLADRQRALEWLADYFGMRPSDKHKAAYDNARLEIERDKVQIMRDKASGPEAPPEPLVLQPVYGKLERDGDA